MKTFTYFEGGILIIEKGLLFTANAGVSELHRPHISMVLIEFQ